MANRTSNKKIKQMIFDASFDLGVTATNELINGWFEYSNECRGTNFIVWNGCEYVSLTANQLKGDA